MNNNDSNAPPDIRAAVAHYQAGRLSQAEAIYRQILQAQPKHPDALHLLGLVAHDVGRHDIANELINQAIALHPSSSMYCNLSIVQKAQGKLDNAIDSCRQAIALDPGFFDAHYHLGNALQGQDKLDEAAVSYQRALQLRPDFAEAHNNLGIVQRALGRLDAALESYRKALAFKPDYPAALVNLANVLMDQGELEAASDYYDKALACEPDSAEACNSLGIALHAQGRLEEALEWYFKALSLQPGFADAEVNLSLLLLYMGRFEPGWRHFRTRVSTELKRCLVFAPDFPFPKWQGEPLAGKALLLWPEQGLGDEIQFCRYVALLKAGGVRHITLVCKRPLVELFRSLQGVDTLLDLDTALAPGFVLPPHDFWSLLLDVPGYCQTGIGDIPATLPYLHADPVEVRKLAPILAGLEGLKVGLCWKAGKGYVPGADRSFDVAVFTTLFGLPGARYFSLQPDTRAEFLAAAGSSGVDLGHEIDAIGPPFQETAALISQLDLVITCDTSIGHLAAALGKPVWVLLPFVSDWRWMEQREDSPWYPNTRLFRQSKRGDWPSLIERVAERLREVIAGASALVWELRPPTSHAIQERGNNIIEVQISVGELLDKITILEIKTQQISDMKRHSNVVKELSILNAVVDRSVELNQRVVGLMNDLRDVNRALWDIEDAIRECEKRQDFGLLFIELARSVYKKNDQRASLKRQINELTGSKLVEEKSYAG